MNLHMQNLKKYNLVELLIDDEIENCENVSFIGCIVFKKSL